MTERIPTLASFNIGKPVFIRKINSRRRWIDLLNSNIANPETEIANYVFGSDKCSLWFIDSDEDFYGFVASISSNRSPQNQNIDFIWATKEDLEKLSIEYQQISEGECLAVKHLHYDSKIIQSQAILLCGKLIARGQEPQRCKKETNAINTRLPKS